jgi:prophage antirepressor-like protein
VAFLDPSWAEAVQAMASWVMAEVVRIFHAVSTKEAQETVDALVERKTPFVWELDGGVKRVLDPSMNAKNQVLTLLYQSTGWLSATDLCGWVEYSNASVFRSKVLTPLHKKRLIGFDTGRGRARIPPRGAKEVEENLLKPAGA